MEMQRSKSVILSRTPGRIRKVKSKTKNEIIMRSSKEITNTH